MSPDSFPLVSIIILNYNCKKFLEDCISSVLDTDYPKFQIIFVDNNSTDDSVDFITEKYNDNRIILKKLSKNYGFATGNNIGAKYATGDYLVFLNPDTKVDSKWLTQIVTVLENNSSIGIAQPKLLQMDKVHFDSAGCFINSFGLIWDRGHGQKDSGQFDKMTEIFYAKGAALFIRHGLWKKLGGFDSQFFNYFEETDLCWRAHELGLKVVYVPRSIVYHVGGGILNDVPYHLKYHEARGRLIILIKNYSLINFFKNVPVTFILHFINILRYFALGKVSNSVAILRGTLWCILNIRKIWRARCCRRNLLHFSANLFSNKISKINYN